MAHQRKRRNTKFRQAWWTPEFLRERLHQEHRLVLDAAACAASTLVPDNWVGPTHEDVSRRDALAYESWEGLVPARDRTRRAAAFINPPFYPPNVLRSFLARAAATRDAGLTVVALVPASVGTGWWVECCEEPGADIEVLRGRLRFGGPHSDSAGPAPWACALVTYRS